MSNKKLEIEGSYPQGSCILRSYPQHSQPRKYTNITTRAEIV